MLPRPFSGLIAAPFLPMKDDQSIDWATLERYMDWIAGQKPDAVVMNMDASEVVSLDDDEIYEVARVCSRAVAKRVPFLSGAGGGSTKAAAKKAEKLAKNGAEGFAVFPAFPTFSGAPVPADMIVRYHRAITDAAGLPIICFQFPKGWGPDYTPDILQAMAEIPQLIAMKESSFDATQTIQAVEAVKQLKRPIGVLTGSDTFIFEAQLMGCGGALIGFAGTATAELRTMIHACRDRDLTKAQTIWDKLGPIARYCWRAPIRDFRPRMKEVLRLQGIFPSAAVREPQLGISGAERAEIAALCRQQGLIG